MFVENLDELGWMDQESKKKAQEKVGEPGRALAAAGVLQPAEPHR